MDKERQLELRREYNRRYREAHRKSNPKKIESKVVVKMYGLRVIVGTFDKHRPDTIYYEGTINCDGTGLDAKKLRVINGELRQVFDDWIDTQDVYQRYYIKVVDTLDTDDRYKPKNKHIKFDLTVKHLKPHRWDEAIELARSQIMCLYNKIAEVVVRNGMVLLDNPGHNSRKVVSPVATEPETS